MEARLPLIVSQFGAMPAAKDETLTVPLPAVTTFSVPPIEAVTDENHYKAGDAPVYDSNQEWTQFDRYNISKDYHYIPWDLERFEGSYGMSLGPSFTVLPFRYVNNDQLHFLKFNMYFRVGYQASILYMSNNYELDKNQDTHSSNFKEVDESLIMHWGHGLLTSFGLSLTWKGIGIGYEHRVAHNRYKSFTTSIFGNDIYKFKTSTDRIFISIRMGR